jgi:ATP-dependent Clp protease ATP-binding subunit ClpA
MGARPLQRLINEKIKVPLSKKILFDNVPVGSQITVDFLDGEYVFNIVVPNDTIHKVDDDGFIVLEKKV